MELDIEKIIIPTGILIGSYQGFLIVEIDFFQLKKCDPGTFTEAAYFIVPMSQ